MTTKFNVDVVERSCAEKYTKALKITNEITPDMVDEDGRVQLKVFQSVEQYNGKLLRKILGPTYQRNNTPRCCSKATPRSHAHKGQSCDETRSIRDDCGGFV
mmetsp:Transcript_17062/g.24132  ORF Transcript_17062/g.24132 Transcript_17062/m.24132 type:complete len:102 (+) Transcript_17062:507-812(+)